MSKYDIPMVTYELQKSVRSKLFNNKIFRIFSLTPLSKIKSFAMPL